MTNLTFQKLVKENQNTYLLYQVVNGVTESFEAANTISTTIPQMMQELQQLGDQMQQIMAYEPPPPPYFPPTSP